MLVNLLTDLPKHNLALMRISAWHRAQGDEITLNSPQTPCDLSYGSWFFNHKYHTDIAGGPAVNPELKLNGQFKDIPPDYDLYPNLDCSLGYTWASCPRTCGFCIVPKQHNPEIHHSIWDFHDTRFKKICLLNNNTFSDPQWRETFEEIWEAKLTIRDENGYDLRFIDEERVEALARTKFDGYFYLSWDKNDDEDQIVKGLKLIKKQKLHNKCLIFVLVGYDTTLEQDIYRCQILHNMGFKPFIMIYNISHKRQLRHFRRMIHLRTYTRYPHNHIRRAWQDYNPSDSTKSGRI